MASKVWNNADADRQYGKGRQIIGPWKSLRPENDTAAPEINVAEEIGNAKRLLTDPRDLREFTRVQEQRDSQDRAQQRAQDASSPIRSLFSSVFSPKQREDTARFIEGDARNEEGVIPRARSFAAGAIGGAGEDSPWGGAMGEVSPVNVATGFGVTRTGPLGTALKLARERQAVNGVRALAQGAEEIATPATDVVKTATAPPAVTDSDGGLFGGLKRWFTGGSGSSETLDLGEEAARHRANLATEGTTSPLDIGAGRSTALPPEDVAAHTVTPPVPKPTGGGRSGLRSGPESAAQWREAQRVATPYDPEREYGSFLKRQVKNEVDQAAAVRGTPADIPDNATARDLEARRVAADRGDVGDVGNEGGNWTWKDMQDALSPGSNREEAIPAIKEPVPSTSTFLSPKGYLPAFGETSEGMAAQRLGIGPKTRTLRPDQSTLDLANELAQSELGPGARVKSLKSYLRPTGDDELSKALRQRAHIADSAARRQAPTLGSEAGFVDPEFLGFAGRTGGGAAVGYAKPEWTGANKDERVEGGVKGALLGAVAPSLVRGLGRLAKAAPQGAVPLGKQVVDEIQNLRYMGALSGKAIPKSVMNNLTAPMISAAEKGSMRPVREFFKPETVRDYFREFHTPTVGEHTQEQVGSPNIFGRILGAGDIASTRALERGGLTADEASRALLRTPTGKLGLTGPVGNLMRSRAGKAGMLFQTNPINQAVHGGSAIAGINLPKGLSPTRARVLAGLAAAIGGGEAYGGADPSTIALTSPLAGVYSLPMLAGAATVKVAQGAAGEARNLIRGLSPAPELGADVIDPRKFVRPITNPAVNSWFGSNKTPVTTKTHRAPRASSARKRAAK